MSNARKTQCAYGETSVEFEYFDKELGEEEQFRWHIAFEKSVSLVKLGFYLPPYGKKWV